VSAVFSFWYVVGLVVLGVTVSCENTKIKF
jgi:hypothetical protein